MVQLVLTLKICQKLLSESKVHSKYVVYDLHRSDGQTQQCLRHCLSDGLLVYCRRLEGLVVSQEDSCNHTHNPE